MSTTVLIVPAAETARPTLTTVDDVSLDFLQAVVGGWIEPISPADADFGAWSGFVDEEGKIKSKPVNRQGTLFADVIGWPGLGLGDFLVGDLILLGADDEGGTASLPAAVIEAAEAFWGSDLRVSKATLSGAATVRGSKGGAIPPDDSWEVPA